MRKDTKVKVKVVVPGTLVGGPNRANLTQCDRSRSPDVSLSACQSGAGSVMWEKRSSPRALSPLQEDQNTGQQAK